MVYVVERYLPGLHRSELLRGLLRLEQGSEKAARGAEVRYLGSTIVLRDEACFCRFEAPSSDAVAEVNRQAGLPFDRIVAAVTVNPKGAEMSVSPSIPATVQIKRGRLIGLVAAVAVLAAAVTWALSSFAFDSGSSTTASSDVQASAIGNPLPPASLHFRVVAGPGSATAAAQDAQYVRGITAMTPVEQAAAFGGHGGVLDALGLAPRDEQYVKGIMQLTPAELQAAFGTGLAPSAVVGSAGIPPSGFLNGVIRSQGAR